MSFISRAEVFLVDQGELANDSNRDMMIDTVAYLLENARGFSNRKSTDTIVNHLRSLGYDNLKREDWQIGVMGKLRDHGIFIGSKKGGHGGIFLINSREDARLVLQSYGTRVEKEARRLQILREQMGELDWL
jgi:hypothetical protein